MKVTVLATSIWLLTAVSGAQAAGYLCASNGTTHYSSQPCPTGGLEYRGPVKGPTQYQPPAPKTGAAPDFQSQLSSRCASLNDAIRIGPARGLKSDTMSDMRQEYQQKCAEEENTVRTQIRNELRDKKRQEQQQVEESQQQETRTKARTELQQQQCDESKRIINTKRARTDLTDGEKGDLQRFVDNHQRRCG